MNQPMGRVVALQYRSIGPRLNGAVVRVHIRTHMDTMDHHDLPNPAWMIHNPTLQFMAVYGLQPSAVDGTYQNVEDEQILVPIIPRGDGWAIAGQALAEGKQALEQADWFDGADDSDDGDGSGGAPHGGGSPDPGTGNRGGVEGPSDVDAEAPEPGTETEEGEVKG